jgi:hypothetical protein
MNYIKKYLPVIILCLFLIADPALAGPSKISSPYVKKGQWEVKNIGTLGFDDDDADEWEHGVEVEYGIAERLKLSAKAEIKDEAGADISFEKIALGTKMQLTEKGAYFVDVGAKLSYDIGTAAGKADKIGATLYLAHNFDSDITARANIKVGHEVGEYRSKDLTLETNIGVYKSFGEFMGGIEYFGDYGDLDAGNSYSEQDHALGPIIGKSWKIDESAELETRFGYYHALSDGAYDHVVKYELEFKF